MVAGGVTWGDRLAVAIGLAALFLIWQGGTMLFAVPDYILPRPLDIAAAIVERRDPITQALIVTGTETIAGFLIGAAVGVGLAVCLVLVPPLEPLLMPLAVAINAVPSVAFVPLALIWFGLGMGSKIAMAVLAVGFIVLLNALSGLKKPEQGHIDLMRSFGAGRIGILWRLRLPAAMPSIATGLRVGLGRSTIAVIVAEMLGAYDGIGQIVYQSTAQVDYLNVWAAVLAAMLGSLALYGCLVAIDRKLIWWR
ncbi:ABC transporter permease [Methyloraptor flagellatus]|jgi:NitT/TauT family transport system permease protein|uniref:ABC transporter permease n=1 Tax=Methyloraptor flagellatus TaxID=3162530 RepID=A0AAU7XFB7_9HYPH